ncbi:MAG: hypothetical protein U9R01_06075 [candidate division WOR-3 bacterium]|nr:hypothetical protein [candidate division WOR-3 bacterium]
MENLKSMVTGFIFTFLLFSLSLSGASGSPQEDPVYCQYIYADCHGPFCMFGEKFTFYVGPRNPVDERIAFTADIIGHKDYGGIGGVRWNSSDIHDAVVRGTIWANAFQHTTAKVLIYYRGTWQDGVPPSDPFIYEFSLRPTLVTIGTPMYAELRIESRSGSILDTEILMYNALGSAVEGKKWRKELPVGFHTIEIDCSGLSSGDYWLAVKVYDGWHDWAYGVGKCGTDNWSIKFKMVK